MVGSVEMQGDADNGFHRVEGTNPREPVSSTTGANGHAIITNDFDVPRTEFITSGLSCIVHGSGTILALNGWNFRALLMRLGIDAGDVAVVKLVFEEELTNLRFQNTETQVTLTNGQQITTHDLSVLPAAVANGLLPIVVEVQAPEPFFLPLPVGLSPFVAWEVQTVDGIPDWTYAFSSSAAELTTGAPTLSILFNSGGEYPPIVSPTLSLPALFQAADVSPADVAEMKLLYVLSTTPPVQGVSLETTVRFQRKDGTVVVYTPPL